MNSDERRRSADREYTTFNVQYALDGENYKNAHGLDFSATGMSMLTKGPIGRSTFVVSLILPGEVLNYEVSLMWERRVEIDGLTWFRSGLQFGRSLPG